MSLGQTFASPRSHTHPIPTSTCALRYTCIRRWTLLGQQLDPAWINCESRHSVLLFGLSGLVSCTRFEPLRLRLGLDPSYHAARRTGSTSVRADRPISPPFTLQAQYFVHRFNRAHLFVFSSLSITSTSFLQTRLLSPARKFSRLDNITRPWQVSTSPACLERPVYSPHCGPLYSANTHPYHLRPAEEPSAESRLLWHASGEFLSPNQTTGESTTSPPPVISTIYSTQPIPSSTSH